MSTAILGENRHLAHLDTAPGARPSGRFNVWTA